MPQPEDTRRWTRPQGFGGYCQGPAGHELIFGVASFSIPQTSNKPGIYLEKPKDRTLKFAASEVGGLYLLCDVCSICVRKKGPRDVFETAQVPPPAFEEWSRPREPGDKWVTVFSTPLLLCFAESVRRKEHKNGRKEGLSRVSSLRHPLTYPGARMDILITLHSYSISSLVERALLFDNGAPEPVGVHTHSFVKESSLIWDYEIRLKRFGPLRSQSECSPSRAKILACLQKK
ncbi:hypothetical protein R3P38DRAFT_2802527 [Favolaschia claudopus]|uniref:Uncharacterized protein n=1 Tax=Favolaschia claudopus TaxID=2862362 RepID=A0AAV9ZUK1_9AGAR